MDLDKLREVVGDYQHLTFVQGTEVDVTRLGPNSHTLIQLGAIELPLVSASILDSDQQGRDYWSEGKPSNDPRSLALERRQQCYDLVLHSLEVFESSANASVAAESLRSLAYELAFSSEDEVFHSILYDWLIERGLADQLLEVSPEVSSLFCVFLTPFIDKTSVP